MTAGNLTASQVEILSSIDTYKSGDQWESNSGLEFLDIEEDITGYARIIKFKNLAQEIGEEVDFSKSELNEFVHIFEGEFKKGKMHGYGRQFEISNKQYKAEMGFFEDDRLNGKGIIWDKLVANNTK